MHFFILIQTLQLLILYMDIQEILANLGYVLLCFFYSIIKANHFLYHFVILLHLFSSYPVTRSFLVPYAYDSIESINYILYRHLNLKQSCKTLFFSFLNLCYCVMLNINFFFMNSLLFF